VTTAKLEAHFANWTPTSENINALPDPIRKYIHDLHTNCDPAGMVRENVLLREEVKRLAALVQELSDERG
jgi:hypothetical protein